MNKLSLILINYALLILLPFSSAKALETSTEGEFDPFMKATLQSAPTGVVPWQDEPEFQAKLSELDGAFLMAAYKTVLHDPLPGEESNVHHAADFICGTVLQPGEVFSQNRTAGPYTSERGFQIGPTYHGTEVGTTVGGGVCKVSSTLFNVVVLSNLEIVERHTHNMPVPYVPYGQDATVSYGAKDFRFKNSTDSPLLIMARGVDNILYIGFYGQTQPPQITWNHEVLNVTKAPVLCKKNRELPAGSERMIHDGMNGAILRSWVTMTFQDGSVETRSFGKVSYNPLPYIKGIG